MPKAQSGCHSESADEEVDQLLGRAKPGEDPYPNLRRWLEKNLFDFHTSEFANTPILWKLATGRLTSGASSEAFACLLDYHRLDVGIFDRIRNRYLERRKAALRQKRDASRQRAGDARLSAMDRVRAQEELERCTDALTQISEFEQALSDLSHTFRERLQERLGKLDGLHEITSPDWFMGHFSDKFMEKVESKRAEWLDALEDLETACSQYAQLADQPVEAHLYELFVYVPAKVLGSTHYSSGGSLFLKYYFKKGQKLADKMKYKRLDRLSKAERLVVELAREMEEDARLGKEIQAACKKLEKRISSDWKTRARRCNHSRLPPREKAWRSCQHHPAGRKEDCLADR